MWDRPDHHCGDDLVRLGCDGSGSLTVSGWLFLLYFVLCEFGRILNIVIWLTGMP